MANKIMTIYEASIEAQASDTILVDTESTGALTTIDNSKTGNGLGCQAYQCYCVVTVAPTVEAKARLYYAGTYTGTPDGFDSGSLSVSFSTTGTFEMGVIYNPAQFSRCKIAAETAGFTASLRVVPILPEAQ